MSATERQERLDGGSAPVDDTSLGDARFATLATDTLRRLLWAAKGAPCTCIHHASALSVGTVNATWISKRHDCPRCTAIRDVCEAVPDVI